jgi:hypothetical protein
VLFLSAKAKNRLYLTHNITVMKAKYILTLLFFVLMTGTSLPSCKTKEGCGLEEKYTPDMETSKRGKSNLFSKEQRKKMKKKS